MTKISLKFKDEKLNKEPYALEYISKVEEILNKRYNSIEEFNIALYDIVKNCYGSSGL